MGLPVIPFAQVLCATDFSPASVGCVPLACAVVGRGGIVHLRHVLEGRPRPGEREEARSRLAASPHIAAARRRAGIRSVVHVVRAGTTATAIAAAIQEAGRRLGVDALVMGTHGRTGLVRLWMGSVADAVVHSSSRPVVLWNPGAPKGSRAEGVGRFRRVLCGTDFLPPGEAARALAFRLARRDGTVHLMHVWQAAFEELAPGVRCPYEPEGRERAVFEESLRSRLLASLPPGLGARGVTAVVHVVHAPAIARTLDHAATALRAQVTVLGGPAGMPADRRSPSSRVRTRPLVLLHLPAEAAPAGRGRGTTAGRARRRGL
jgi:nucleotide-binding universal stress UspA family protein